MINCKDKIKLYNMNYIEESDKDVAESEKSDVVPETDVIQEEAGDIVEPENEAEASVRIYGNYYRDD